MKLKRLFTLFLAVLMAAAFAAACSPQSGGGNANDVIELRVLNYYDMTTSGSAEEIEVVWQAFENAHPNIKLVREDLFNDPFHNAVEEYAASDTLPDVMFCWPSGRSTTLHVKRLLKDLSPLMERDGLSRNLISIATDPAAQAGGYMAMIPMGVTVTNVFFANLEVLNEVGLAPAKTYSELAAQVPILQEAGYDTLLMPNRDTWVMQSCLFSLVAGRFMGEDWEKRILSGETDFTDPDFIAALDFIKTMYDDGVLNRATLDIAYDDGPALFAANKAAYYIDGDWRVGAFTTDFTSGNALIKLERQENFLVSVFPDIDLPGVKFNRSNTAVLTTGWGINANLADDSAKLEAAWTLVKWLSGEEVQSFKLRTGNITTPSWIGINFNSLALEPLQVALANLTDAYDRATIVIDGSFEKPVHEPLNDGLRALGLGDMTAREVAETTQTAFEAWKETL